MIDINKKYNEIKKKFIYFFQFQIQIHFPNFQIQIHFPNVSCGFEPRKSYWIQIRKKKK